MVYLITLRLSKLTTIISQMVGKQTIHGSHGIWKKPSSLVGSKIFQKFHPNPKIPCRVTLGVVYLHVRKDKETFEFTYPRSLPGEKLNLMVGSAKKDRFKKSQAGGACGLPGRYLKRTWPTNSWCFGNSFELSGFGEVWGYLPRVCGQNHWVLVFWKSLPHYKFKT